MAHLSKHIQFCLSDKNFNLSYFLSVSNFKIQAMLQSNLAEQKLIRYQYISHWIPLKEILKRCSEKKPFVKLRKFNEKQFQKKNEISYNHLFIQKIYLICVAMQEGLMLELSENYYVQNGLIFGIYSFRSKNEERKNVFGIKMIQQVEQNNSLSFFDVVQQTINKYLEFIEMICPGNSSEYQQFHKSINELFQIYSFEIKPEKFIEQFEKWPFAEHYVFNVKLKNALLLREITEDHQLRALYQNYINWQSISIKSLYQQQINVMQFMAQLEMRTAQIYQELEKKGKVAEFKLHSSRNSAKNKYKEIKQIKVSVSFRVILSPSRTLVTVNQKMIQVAEDIQSNSLKKIEIKAQNGLISPRSGNVITVNAVWQIVLANKLFSLKVQCFNNRQLEEIYFDEVQQFWSDLQYNQQFRDLIGVDKYSLYMNENKRQVAITNFIPGCMLSAAIKQIDKIVGLAISIDEVIQICQRKGLENEDIRNYEIQKYMTGHTKQKFSRVLNEIEKNSSKLFTKNKIY